MKQRCLLLYRPREGEATSLRFQEHSSDCLHTYIIGHYNPSARIIDLVSHSTYALIFYMSGVRKLGRNPD